MRTAIVSIVQQTIQDKKGTDQNRDVGGKEQDEYGCRKSIAGALALRVSVADVVQCEDIDASWAQSMHS